MKFWLAVVSGALLAGCATQAYRAVEQECSATVFADYPVQKVQQIETRQRMVQISTGMRSCFASRDGNQMRTLCTDITRPELLTYQEMREVDQNETVRNMASLHVQPICVYSVTAMPSAKQLNCWCL
ncbi:hypothetical protein [Limnohabitans sp.]|uniref:hypothetical protein n=1 Tax=Limnohabitans sp. TaxID=1907725 RepID=UPI00286F849E|nr:hypothetical protein [Limnohabitans sp.]